MRFATMFKGNRNNTAILRSVGAALVAGGILAGCAERIDTRGNLPDPDVMADIKPGEVSRREVEEILGSPSTVSTFGDETWYYISQRTETTAFFEPEVTQRQILVLKFNDQGMLAKMETVGLDASKEVEPVERETPTAGNELGFIEQMIGNVGRYNK